MSLFLIDYYLGGPLAHLVEHLTFNQVVLGSSPRRHTLRFPRIVLMSFGFFFWKISNYINSIKMIGRIKICTILQRANFLAQRIRHQIQQK